MAIILRSPREIDLIRKAGSVVAKVLSKLKEMAEPGISTAELDNQAKRMTADFGAEALFLGVKNPSAKFPFPGAICASLNNEVVHGIPSKEVVLKNGDILSIDFGVRLDGYCGDAAVTIAVGDISAQDSRLIDVTKRVLEIAQESMAPGVKWSTVAAQMQKYAEGAGFSVVRDFVGHGIGRSMHEEPKVPNFVSKELLADDIILSDGMILAVEPMINAGKKEVRTLKNGWVVVTKDSAKSAHFEHTIAITSKGCEIMTVE
ncbi:MAG: type I methionyl aminopeptidase [Sedimentisphaerales bacterium]|nr:type I methionyl aminopeptidase [Sedimentisphaerales bacterium]